MKIEITIAITAIAAMVTLPAIAGDSVLFPPEKAKEMLSQCSRDTPEYEGEWSPTKKQIKQLEANLDKLLELEAYRGKIEGNLKDYNMQYVGIVSEGQQVIYINAFEWGFSKTTPLIICDGGKRFWGAIYHPKTNEFSNLSFNGE